MVGVFFLLEPQNTSWGHTFTQTPQAVHLSSWIMGGIARLLSLLYRFPLGDGTTLSFFTEQCFPIQNRVSKGMINTGVFLPCLFVITDSSKDQLTDIHEIDDLKAVHQLMGISCHKGAGGLVSDPV